MCGIISLIYYVEYGYYMVVLYDSKVPYNNTFLWISGAESYPVFEYSFENFQALLKQVFPKMNSFRRLLTRGFTDSTYIYTLNNKNWYAKIGYDRMMRHEVAHIKDEGDHRWWVPDLMHPSWLFRWSDKIW
jgi:hypothetical protein